MSYVLGIDGGGTNTVCIVMDDTGKVIGRGKAGASNYQSVGTQATLLSIQTAIGQAIKHTVAVEISAICLGLAGVSRPQDIQVVQGLVQQLKTNNTLPITWNLQPSRVIICSDAEIALVGGLGHHVGIVAICGTGSIAYGRNRQGDTKRVGGWGYKLGDEGSAYHIAILGMKAALRAYDGRSQPTILQEELTQHLALNNIEDLIPLIYHPTWRAKDIAALAPIIDRAASSGDIIATTIIEQATQELVKTTKVIIDAIFTRPEQIEIVTIGSVWQSLSNIRQKFAESILTLTPLAKLTHPKHEPAYGAALLALSTLQKP